MRILMDGGEVLLPDSYYDRNGLVIISSSSSFVLLKSRVSSTGRVYVSAYWNRHRLTESPL